MAGNWWDAPQFGQAYQNWWNNLNVDKKTINGMSDYVDTGINNPAENATGFFQSLVDPSGAGGKYGVMSPYSYKRMSEDADNIYNNFLMETMANLPNSTDAWGNVITSGDYANYLKNRMSPYGFKSGTGLGVPGTTTAGQSLTAGYVYSPEQSQAILRTALQNLSTAYQSSASKAGEWDTYTKAYNAAWTKLNNAYTQGYNKLKELYTTAGKDPSVANGFTTNLLRQLLTTGTATATYTDATGTHTLGTVSMGYAPATQTSYQALFGQLLPAGNGTTVAAQGGTMDLNALDPSKRAFAAVPEIDQPKYLRDFVQQMGLLAGDQNALTNAFTKAGTGRGVADYYTILKNIAAGNNGRNFSATWNPWAANSAEQAAQDIMQGGTTGNGMNRLYDMLWSGLGAGYGGIARSALKNQFQRQVNSMANTALGSNGLNFLQQLAALFNQYAARQGIAPINLG